MSGDYRVYSMSGSGKVIAADWIKATDDVEAVAIARGMHVRPLQFAVWQKARRVYCSLESASEGRGVSFMVTQSQRKELRQRGYSDEAIRAMTPAQAHQLLGIPFAV
jgi:hypothetical protein